MTTAKVLVYTIERCPYCVNAKNLLNLKKVAFTEIRVDDNPTERTKMEALSGRRTVPQIFINDQSIGGFDDLKRLNDAGTLDKLLES
ncbi:MAG: Glutaredoxin-3 [Pseudomonadota bacterium]|jgi:glutaredoxin 3